MKTYTSLSLVISFALLPLTYSHAVTVEDVHAVINQRLSTKPDYYLEDVSSTKEEVIETGEGLCRDTKFMLFGHFMFLSRLLPKVIFCSPTYEKKKISTSTPRHGKLTISNENIVLVDTNINLGKIDKGLPKHVSQHWTEFPNCTSLTQSFNDDLQMQVKESISLSETKTISTTNNRHVELESRLFFNALSSVGIRIGLSESKTIGSANQNAKVHEETLAVSKKVSMSVRPMTLFKARINLTRFLGNIPYSGTATVDGNLNSNNAGLTRLSQVLSLEERTFSIEGNINYAATSNTTIQNYERPLSVKECEGGID
ncbi:MAG: hypothetical protein ACH34X_07750 [Thiolinea sp.]